MSKINPEQIIGGGGSGSALKTIPFDFTTVSPLVLQSVAIGQLIYQSIVIVITAFNDSNTYIQVGTTSDPDMFFAIGDINPMVINQYNNGESILIATNDLLIMTISPGASTTGSGIIYYWIT